MTPTSRLWVECLVVAVAVSVSNGPIIAWQTLEPIMIGDGVYEDLDPGERDEQLDDLNAISLAVGGISCLLAGILYDHFGPRALAVVGAIGTSLGLVGMAAAIQRPSLNGLLGPSYIGCVFMAFLNSWGSSYYFIRLPSHPYMVAAVGASSFALGDAFGIVAALLNSELNVTSWEFYYGMAVLSLIGGSVCFVLLPPLSVFQAERAASRDQHGAGNATSTTAKDAADGGGDKGKDGTGDVAGRGCLLCLADFLRSLWAACLLFGSVPELALETAHVTALYMLVAALQVHQYQLYVALFGSSEAIFLVDLSSLIFAIGGVAALLSWGAVAYGMSRRTVYLVLDVCTLVFFISVATPLVPAQIVGQLMLTVLFNLVANALALTIAFAHAPAIYFGQVAGLIWMAQGLCQLISTPLQEWAARQEFPHLTNATFGEDDDLDDDLDANASPRIFVVFYGWFVVTAITGLALHWRLWRRGEAEHEIKAEGLATTMGTSREPPVNEATRLIARVEVCSAAVL